MQEEPAKSAAREPDEAVSPKAEPVLLGNCGGDVRSDQTRDVWMIRLAKVHSIWLASPLQNPDRMAVDSRQIDLTRPDISRYRGYMEAEDTILALAALAQPTRLEAFRLLVGHEPKGLAAGDIAKALAVPQNTMSSHLAVLSRAGLISAERFSRSIIYRAELSHLRSVMLFMLRDCCEGRPEICAPLIEDLAPCCPPPSKKQAHAKL